ncbi:COG1361 S-layer family protein [Candidatus Woesearchaeota archaeon]|nr:COG1361 S-layer family protein [Candidatus Woesearchaeota archaeon]
MKTRRYIMIITMFIMLMSSVFAQITDLFGEEDTTTVTDPQSTKAEVPHSNVKVTFLSQDPDPVEPGEFVELRFRVENFGIKPVNTVVFNLELQYPFSFADPEKKYVDIGTLGARQTEEDSAILFWRLKVDDNAAEGEEEFTLIYNTEKYGVILDDEPTFKIRVRGRESILGVESIETIPPQPKPGDQVQVRVTLKNLAESSIDEVKVKLVLDETSVAPLTSASEKVIREILPGKTESVLFDLIVPPDAESKVNLIPLQIEYMDKFNQEHVVEAKFGLTVYSPPEYELVKDESNVFLSEQQGTVVLSVSNTGTSDINFVVLELIPTENYEILSSSKSYLGNIESDDYETAEFEIYTHKLKPGIIPLKVTMKYKDSFNQDFIKEEQMELRIFSKEEARKFGLLPQPPYMSMGIGILVFALLLWYILHRRRKKKHAKAMGQHA